MTRRTNAALELRTKQRELERREGAVLEVEKALIAKDLERARESIAKDYNLKPESLATIDNEKDMLIYALQNKPAASNAADGSANGGNRPVQPQHDRGGAGNAAPGATSTASTGIDRVQEALAARNETVPGFG